MQRYGTGLRHIKRECQLVSVDMDFAKFAGGLCNFAVYKWQERGLEKGMAPRANNAGATVTPNFLGRSLWCYR
jgi:hypothetical protein